MEVQGYHITEGLLYTKDHEWARVGSSSARVGITDYAAKSLNDIVYVTLPKVGENIIQFKSIGTVESIKAVSEIYSPFSGVVLETNSRLDVHPELVNKSPYDEGWLLNLDLSNVETERGKLFGAEAYASHLSSVLK